MTTPEVSHTIYVKGINDKIKPDNIKKSLYLLFGQYGEVIDVCLRPGQKWRGQAWVVFKFARDANRAKIYVNDELFYGKPLILQFSKNKSDIVAKADGTYASRGERKLQGLDKALADGDEGGKKRQLEELELGSNKRQKTGENTLVNDFPYKILSNPADSTEAELMAQSTLLYASNFPSSADLGMITTFFSEHGVSNVRALSVADNNAILQDFPSKDLIKLGCTGYILTFPEHSHAKQSILQKTGFKFDDDHKLQLFYMYDINNKRDPQQEVSLMHQTSTNEPLADAE